MKTSLTIFVFSMLVVVAYAAKCIEQAECDEGTCCAGIPPFGGVCLPLTPEGGKCHVVDKTVPIFGDFYIGSCPCADGLVCVQQGKKKNDGVCQLPPTTPAPIADDSASNDDAADDDAVNDSADVAEDDSADVVEDDSADVVEDDSADDVSAVDVAAAEAVVA